MGAEYMGRRSGAGYWGTRRGLKFLGMEPVLKLDVRALTARPVLLQNLSWKFLELLESQT